jgi:hypothetical protein
VTSITVGLERLNETSARKAAPARSRFIRVYWSGGATASIARLAADDLNDNKTMTKEPAGKTTA